ncbi:carbohydrate binding domain-containing protein [Hymenobacter monticola]|uniref:Carbohydrate binding domain-containing protein n=1 Tax=Hymenobacter monticola TaxID=1705399 RepID=A0ABY4B7M9_9BACT|nr:carbohydrate binding domain-containing protein [Hymenobacter monticola]UOE35142.1 carbohydrate binding domain-containing protein [Hymenobacter monticola]
MKKYTLLLLTAAALAGCGDKDGGSRPANLLTGNDFEQMDGWMGDVPQPSLTKEKAHSGAYSVHVGPGIEYSNGFIGTLGKLSSTRLNQIKVKAWVYVPSGPTATSIVTSLVDPATPGAKPAMWDAMGLDKMVKKRNDWQEVEKTFTLPANVGPNYKLYVYLWSGGSQNVAYLDDIQFLRP